IVAFPDPFSAEKFLGREYLDPLASFATYPGVRSGVGDAFLNFRSVRAAIIQSDSTRERSLPRQPANRFHRQLLPRRSAAGSPNLGSSCQRQNTLLRRSSSCRRLNRQRELEQRAAALLLRARRKLAAAAIDNHATNG